MALYFPIFHFSRVCFALPSHIPKPNAAMLSTKSPSSSRALNSSQINSGLTSAVLLQVSTTSSVSCTTLSTTSSWVICKIDISLSIMSILNYLVFHNGFLLWNFYNLFWSFSSPPSLPLTPGSLGSSRSTWSPFYFHFSLFDDLVSFIREAYREQWCEVIYRHVGTLAVFPWLEEMSPPCL